MNHDRSELRSGNGAARCIAQRLPGPEDEKWSEKDRAKNGEGCRLGKRGCCRTVTTGKAHQVGGPSL